MKRSDFLSASITLEICENQVLDDGSRLGASILWLLGHCQSS